MHISQYMPLNLKLACLTDLSDPDIVFQLLKSMMTSSEIYQSIVRELNGSKNLMNGKKGHIIILILRIMCGSVYYIKMAESIQILMQFLLIQLISMIILLGRILQLQGAIANGVFLVEICIWYIFIKLSHFRLLD